MLTGQNRPVPGVTYRISLAAAGEVGRPYLAAASFSTRPGIPTPAGTVHLRLDTLFTASQTLPAVFNGFSGALTASGLARLAIVLPPAPALQGLRFFVGAVTYGPAGIRRIAEPLGVSIE